MTIEYSQDELCDYIAKGKSLVNWCKETGVSYTRIMVDLRKDEEFQQKYTRAREDQADYLADEIIEICDEAEVKYIKDGDEQRLALDATAIARNRLRVDTRKWAASKMKPKKYGDKQTISGDPDAPLVTFTSIVQDLDGRSSGLPEIEG